MSTWGHQMFCLERETKKNILNEKMEIGKTGSSPGYWIKQ